MKEALIGIAGLGTVGKGTLDLLTANKGKIETLLDISIKVTPSFPGFSGPYE